MPKTDGLRFVPFLLFALLVTCGWKRGACAQSSVTKRQTPESHPSRSAAEILGDPDCLAVCYGGYRGKSRTDQPSVDQLMEDMRILAAMGIKIVRTYNTQQFSHAANLLEAIHRIKQSNRDFEMYVMLGAWISCQGDWTDDRDHSRGNETNNSAEIAAAVSLAKKYPDIVKVIAVGNEAMVHWATQYYVQPKIILKWVAHLQSLKAKGEIPSDLWITSSDNYESWGGGAAEYRTEALEALVAAVDYVSLHTYPFHETHYDREYWGVPDNEKDLPEAKQADAAVERAVNRAREQYQATADYITSIGHDKPIHIGETGWATSSSGAYGANGSRAADEYKMAKYYLGMRGWTNKERIACFYFEAFDERWKDQGSEDGSENHFGLITLQGKAKYPIWRHVDAGDFNGLTRDGQPITKSFGGDKAAMRASMMPVPRLSDLGRLAITTTNDEREIGEAVTESRYVVVHQTMTADAATDTTFPSEPIKLNIWEGTCDFELTADQVAKVKVSSVPDGWWGCGMLIESNKSGENLKEFASGKLHFDLRGDTKSSFNIGFQSGNYVAGNQTNNFVTFGDLEAYRLSSNWKSYSIPIAKLNRGADLSNVTSLLYVFGPDGGDGKGLEIRNIFYSK